MRKDEYLPDRLPGAQARSYGLMYDGPGRGHHLPSYPQPAFTQDAQPFSILACAYSLDIAESNQTV